MDRMAWCLFALLALHGLIQIGSGDLVKAGDGLGWDGVLYGKLSQDLPGQISRHGIPRDRIDRLFPVAIAAGALLVLPGERSTRAVVGTYLGLNYLLILLSGLLCLRIARLRNWKGETRAVVFFGLFFNFALAKQPFYDPVLVDTFAFTLSLATLTAWLQDQRLLLAFSVFIGWFTWPFAALYSGLLLLFPRGEYLPSRAGWIRLLPAAFSAILFKYLLGVRGWRIAGWSEAVRILSVVIFFSAGLLPLAQFPLRSGSVRSVIRGSALFLTAVLPAIALHYLIRERFGIRSVGPDDFRGLVRSYLLAPPLARAGNFLVPHFVYFGPLIGLVLLCWRKIGQTAAAHGPALLAIAASCVVFALDWETRHSIYLLPFLAFLLAEALESTSLRSGFVGPFCVLCVVTCRSFWPIRAAFLTREDWFRFPGQAYYMNHGPWISGPVYAYEALFSVLLLLILYMGLPGAIPRPPGASRL